MGAVGTAARGGRHGRRAGRADGAPLGAEETVHGRATPEVAVVALTAAAGEREVEALLEAGAVACIGKDQPLDEIVDAVLKAAA